MAVGVAVGGPSPTRGERGALIAHKWCDSVRLWLVFSLIEYESQPSANAALYSLTTKLWAHVCVRTLCADRIVERALFLPSVLRVSF